MSAARSGDSSFRMIEAVAVPERLEGAPAQVRRRWSSKFREQAVAETLMPGANVSAVARRIGIAPSQLFAWRKKALCQNRTDHLPQRDSAAVDGRLVEVVVGAIVIRCGATIEEQHLQRLIRVVRSA
jgi:transposase